MGSEMCIRDSANIYPISISSTGSSTLPAKFHGHFDDISFFNSRQYLMVTASNGQEWGALPGPFLTSHIRAHQGFYLENLLPFPLGIKVSDQTIFTYTSEQGIFSTPTAPIDSQLSQLIITNVSEAVNTDLNFKIQPNPSYENPILTLQTEVLINLKIDLFGIDGKLKRKILGDSHLARGDHNLSINLEGLPSGVYFLRIRLEKEDRWEKIILLK